MMVLEILVFAAIGYLILLLLLELVVWQVQPDMEDAVTLHVQSGDTVVTRKLYGLKHQGTLYVASNHWFRSWYHAARQAGHVEVEHNGATTKCRAIPLVGEEHKAIAAAYDQGLMLKLLCGFAPQRFLRLEPV